MRLKIIRIAVAGLFLLIVMDLFYVQVIRGRYFYNLSKNNRIRVVPIEGKRGQILDRAGVVLATNRVSLNVMVMPQEIKDLEELFSFLSTILKVDAQSLFRKYRQKMFAPFAPVVVAENIDREVAIVLEENKFRFPGLFIQESFRRFYPFGGMDAHVIGYVSKISGSRIEKLKDYGYTAQSNIGYSGVEEFYDSVLKGQEGGFQIEVNSRGQQVRLLSLKDPLKGEDISLTIDNRVQRIASELLGERSGAIVVMDLSTGEILGMTSTPAYDPNVFVRGATQAEADFIFANPSAPLMNRAVNGRFPPGSVFKIPVAAGALETGKIKTSTSFLCPGFYKLGNRQFRCTHVHGLQDLVEAIAHSCNVYFYHVGGILGSEVISQYARMFGLGSITRVDLPFEEPGFIPSAEQRRKDGRRWYKGDTLNLSIGQGDVLTTPLQLVRLMAIIANNGQDVHPHVIRAVGASLVRDFSESGRVNISGKTFQIIQEGLQDVVDEDSGTGHLLDIPGLKVSGKTGTAQTSGGRDNHAWFAGFSESKKSKIAFCVFLEHGGSSRNAVEISRDMLIRMQEEEAL